MGLLHEAAKSGDLLLAQEILKDPDSDTLEDGIHTKDLHDQTVLHMGAKYERMNILEWALKAGCDVNAQTVAGDTPLILAAQAGKMVVIKLLIENKANVNLANDHGNTALHYACFWRNLEMILFLQSCGALVLVKNKHGKTPLQLTSESLALKLRELALNEEDTVVEAKARSTVQVLEENKARFMSKTAVGWEIPSTNVVLFLEPKGQTQYAEVHKGQWTNYTVAIKRLLDQQMTDEEIKTIRNELSTARKLQHTNIAAVRAGCVTPPYISTLIEWGELGTLREFLQDPNQEMDQALAMKLATGVAQGMAYLHGQTPPVYHMNLKSSNVLVMSDFTPKVSEYGYRESPLLHRNRQPQRLLNPEWVAPELLRNIFMGDGNNMDFAAADVYSYGILLFEIVTRTPPYDGMNAMYIGVKVLLEGARPALPEYVPEELTALIEQCWADDPSQRPTFEHIVEMLSRFQTNEDEYSRVVGIDEDNNNKSSSQELALQTKKTPKVINNRSVVVDSEDDLVESYADGI